MTVTKWEALDTVLSSEANEIAPDGSPVRVLARLDRGSMGHFTTPAGQTIRAVCHKTVDELWFVISGHGEMWRSDGTESSITPFAPGHSLAIPVGTIFQVRNVGQEDICVLGQTMPAWPDNSEATIEQGIWTPTMVSND